MVTEEKILIPARSNVSETYLYTKKIQVKKIDAPTLILVPGGPGGNHTVFNGILDKLTNFANIILFDPRGCGSSDPADAQHCTINDYIEDIEALRVHFDLKKIILFGGSYGSMAAIGYATKYSKNLEKLVLLAGAANGEFIETAKKNLEKIGSDEQKILAEKLWNGLFLDPCELSLFYKKMASLYSVKPQLDLPTTKPGVPYNIDVLNLGFKKFLRTFNFESELSKIKTKTLIICGAQDWINDPLHARLLAEKIPHAKLHILDECGHFVWADQPELFFAALNDFFK